MRRNRWEILYLFLDMMMYEQDVKIQQGETKKKRYLGTILLILLQHIILV
jgi:hypothetical protein